MSCCSVLGLVWMFEEFMWVSLKGFGREVLGTAFLRATALH